MITTLLDSLLPAWLVASAADGWGRGEIVYSVARGAALGLALLLALGLERRRPHAQLRPAWRTNLGLFAVDTAAMAVVCGACGWAVASWANARGLGLLHGLGDAALVPGVLALDAVAYAWHRANHRAAFLWRFHRVHHTDVAFHATTALRFHPGELLLALPVRLAAVVALGIAPEAVLVFEVIFGVANLVEHGNFDPPRRAERWAERLFVTPALHRGHHAASWSELDTNFGTIFSWWDRLGGTYRACSGDQQVTTGLPDSAGPPDPALAATLLAPFRRLGRPPR